MTACGSIGYLMQASQVPKNALMQGVLLFFQCCFIGMEIYLLNSVQKYLANEFLQTQCICISTQINLQNFSSIPDAFLFSTTPRPQKRKNISLTYPKS